MSFNRFKKAATILVVLTAIGLSGMLVSRQVATVPQDSPAPASEGERKLWAGLSVNSPIFYEEDVASKLQFQFGLINEGGQTVDPKIREHPRLIVNGKELEELPKLSISGSKDAQFHSLAASDRLEFSISAGRCFAKPGLYKVCWQGEGFRSTETVFRVIKKDANAKKLALSPSGMTLFPLRVSNDAASPFIYPGSKVDLMCTMKIKADRDVVFPRPGDRAVVFPILIDMQILAVDTDTTVNSSKLGYTGSQLVSLATTDEQWILLRAAVDKNAGFMLMQHGDEKIKNWKVPSSNEIWGRLSGEPITSELQVTQRQIVVINNALDDLEKERRKLLLENSGKVWDKESLEKELLKQLKELEQYEKQLKESKLKEDSSPKALPEKSK